VSAPGSRRWKKNVRRSKKSAKKKKREGENGSGKKKKTNAKKKISKITGKEPTYAGLKQPWGPQEKNRGDREEEINLGSFTCYSGSPRVKATHQRRLDLRELPKEKQKRREQNEKKKKKMGGKRGFVGKKAWGGEGPGWPFYYEKQQKKKKKKKKKNKKHVLKKIKRGPGDMGEIGSKAIKLGSWVVIRVKKDKPGRSMEREGGLTRRTKKCFSKESLKT